MPGLAKARELRGWDQRELAERAGFPAAMISHFEVGERGPSVESLTRLADALSVSCDFLLGREKVTQPSGPQLGELLKFANKLDGRDLDSLVAQVEAILKTRSGANEASRNA